MFAGSSIGTIYDVSMGSVKTEQQNVLNMSETPTLLFYLLHNQYSGIFGTSRNALIHDYLQADTEHEMA